MKICKILKDDLRGQSIFQSKESKRLTERANRMRDEHISGSQRYYSSSLRAICEALCYVYDTNSKQRTFEDRLCALRFYLSAIRQDVVVDSRAQFLYGKYLCSLDTELFPTSEPASENPAPSRDVDISVTDTLTLFCKAESTGRSPADVARNGLWTSRKYMATYYPEIDMVKVSNGRHHIGAACLDRPSRGEIIIPCMECSLLESFRRFSTDGGLWLDMSKPRSRQTDFTDVKRSDVVKDFRLALIFSLAQAIEKFTRNDPDMPVNSRLASYLQPFCPDSVVLKRNDTSDRDVACERVETKPLELHICFECPKSCF